MKTVLFQGDSVTDAGRQRSDDRYLGSGYPTVTAALLSAKYPGKLRFLNRGVSGNRIPDLYARIGSDIINLKPDYLTIMIGINDVWHELGGNRNGTSDPKFFRIYCEMIEEILLMCPGVRILILEPFVLQGSATKQHWDIFREETALRASSARRAAEKYALTFVPLQEKLNAAAKEAAPEYWLYDGVHPTCAGHGLIAEEVAKALEREFKDI